MEGLSEGKTENDQSGDKQCEIDHLKFSIPYLIP